jgi:two-component system nitrogen regulation sensor histidine kinase NtrY
VAFLITAIAPLVLITLYSRYHTEQRLAEATALRLQDQTSAVSTNIMMGLGRDETDMMQVTPPVAEAIASDLGTDFNLYIGDELIVSSRPELFEIGLLDRRISGGAYRHVVLSGERFFFENESIGRTTYAVGYRPVLDFEGAIMGVVSVPTLYRQDLIEEEEAVRNALLLSAYGMVLVFLLVLAASFAGRIAAPIQRLTEATKQVAHGNLDVTVTPIRMRYRAGDEIDELIRSFDAMTGELKRSRDELVRFERELAWKEMAKQVAHEIKNPLTPMRLSVQHLRQTFQDRVPDFDKVLESVTKTIVEQIDTLSRIASEFSHFARMPRREIAECDVNTLVRESLNLFAQEVGIRFETRLAEDLPLIAADREELRRAFINILRNSVQALEGRGKVVVATRKEKEGVRIAFRDFGPGIPEEVKAKLFQPNFSTKTDGMGLGLAIVKKTIDDLGGTVRIDSTLGEGTTVTIQIPAAAGAAL